MRIQCSVGNAGKNADVRERAYSLKLMADSQGDKQWIAALYRLLLREGAYTVLRAEYELRLEETPIDTPS